MNMDLSTMASYGFTFYNDELNESDLRNLAEGTSNSNTAQLPMVISISFVDLTSEVGEDQDEPIPMEIEKNNNSPTSEPNTNSYKDQKLRVIEQYNSQQSRSPSPASSQTSAASTDEVSEDTSPKLSEKVKKPRVYKYKLPRDEPRGEFFCEKCRKNFRSKRGLSQHPNSHHNGVKAHGCEVCGKRFDLLAEMKKHRERHSTENKPFECRIEGCPKRFMHEFDMERHVAVRHGKAPYSCDLCGKVFGRKDHREKHMLGHKYNTKVPSKN